MIDGERSRGPRCLSRQRGLRHLLMSFVSAGDRRQSSDAAAERHDHEVHGSEAGPRPQAVSPHRAPETRQTVRATRGGGASPSMWSPRGIEPWTPSVEGNPTVFTSLGTNLLIPQRRRMFLLLKCFFHARRMTNNDGSVLLRKARSISSPRPTRPPPSFIGAFRFYYVTDGGAVTLVSSLLPIGRHDAPCRIDSEG